jgi:hypothetical protein
MKKMKFRICQISVSMSDERCHSRRDDSASDLLPEYIMQVKPVLAKFSLKI